MTKAISMRRNMTTIILLLTMCSSVIGQASYDDLVGNAESLRREGKTEAALALGFKASKLLPKRHEALLLISLVLYSKGEEAEANVFIQRALKLAPQSEKTSISNIASLLAKGQNDRLATKTIADARQARSAGLHAKAAGLFQRAVKLTPYNLELGRETIAELMYLKQFYEVAKVLRGLELAPDPTTVKGVAELNNQLAPLINEQWKVVMKSADASAIQRDWQACESAAQKAVVFAPYKAKGHYMLAIAFTRLGRFDDACVAAGKSLAAGFFDKKAYTDIEDFNPLFGYATYLQLLTDAFGKMTADKARSLARSPKQEVRRIIGFADKAAKEGKKTLSKAWMQEALTLFPKDPHLHFRFATLCAQTYLISNSRKHLVLAIENGYDDLDTWFKTQGIEMAMMNDQVFTVAHKHWQDKLGDLLKISDTAYFGKKTSLSLRALAYTRLQWGEGSNYALRSSRIYAEIGDKEKALDWLLKGAKLGFKRVQFVVDCKSFDKYRSAPKYIEALQQIGRNQIGG